MADPYQQALDRLNARHADEAPATVYRWARGTVKTVTAGAAADGHTAVVVTVNGDDLPAPYYAGYTPTVGDMVDVRFDNGSPVITGHIIGLPAF